MKYENLTKENFFNEMKEKYPIAMEKFCKWIDKYKEENDWENLFGNKFKSKNERVKYHDLPIQMQIALWMNFYVGVSGHFNIPDDIVKYAKTIIEAELTELEYKFKNQN